MFDGLLYAARVDIAEKMKATIMEMCAISKKFITSCLEIYTEQTLTV